MMDYPTYDQLIAAGSPPEPLYIGSHEQLQAMGADYVPFTRITPDKPDKATARAQFERHSRKRGRVARRYASRFVGVARVKERWVAQLDAGKQGPRRIDELEAAWDRAIALGRPGLEERPLDQVRPRDEPRAAAPHEPRGHAKKPLGGKRIV
jgi:hypothetical protein